MPKILHAVALSLALSCASENAQLSTQLAPSVAHEQHKVSVLGVYKDGRLDSEYWDTLAPAVAAALGPGACEAAFSPRLQGEAPELYERTDHDAKDEGISAALVARLADRANGDSILVFEVSGRIPSKGPTGNAPLATSGSAASRHGRTGGGGRGMGLEPARDESALVLTWRLFSTQSHESLGESTLSYTGQSSDEAMKLFLDKLRAQLPGAACASWKWGAAPEPASVQ